MSEYEASAECAGAERRIGAYRLQRRVYTDSNGSERGGWFISSGDRGTGGPGTLLGAFIRHRRNVRAWQAAPPPPPLFEIRDVRPDGTVLDHRRVRLEQTGYDPRRDDLGDGPWDRQRREPGGEWVTTGTYRDGVWEASDG